MVRTEAVNVRDRGHFSLSMYTTLSVSTFLRCLPPPSCPPWSQMPQLLGSLVRGPLIRWQLFLLHASILFVFLGRALIIWSMPCLFLLEMPLFVSLGVLVGCLTKTLLLCPRLASTGPHPLRHRDWSRMNIEEPFLGDHVTFWGQGHSCKWQWPWSYTFHPRISPVFVWLCLSQFLLF